ncbi:MAG: ribonuclease E inhibitor RraB [Bdellovibrionales bacterium]|nr:ribonuclease E inhibitor RraB [Massilia sp.]
MDQSREPWPDDVDGDVLRRMDEDGFDFSVPTDIDFNIDFEAWPPSAECMAKLAGQYPDVHLVEPEADDDGVGYVQVVVRDVVSYELVMRVQRKLTALVEPYGGLCESWGAYG